MMVAAVTQSSQISLVIVVFVLPLISRVRAPPGRVRKASRTDARCSRHTDPVSARISFSDRYAQVPQRSRRNRSKPSRCNKEGTIHFPATPATRWNQTDRACTTSPRHRCQGLPCTRTVRWTTASPPALWAQPNPEPPYPQLRSAGASAPRGFPGHPSAATGSSSLSAREASARPPVAACGDLRDRHHHRRRRSFPSAVAAV